MTRPTRDDDYFLCPHCGAELRAGASFCRECGASEESGWDEDAAWSGDDDDDFDYDEYLAREFPTHAPRGPSRPSRWLVALIVALLCLAMLLWTLRGG